MIIVHAAYLTSLSTDPYLLGKEVTITMTELQSADLLKSKFCIVLETTCAGCRKKRQAYHITKNSICKYSLSKYLPVIKFLIHSEKMSQEDCQFPALTKYFDWLFITTLYQLKLQSWYKTSAHSLVNMLYSYNFHGTIGYLGSSMTC